MKLLVAIRPVPNPDERVRIADDGRSIALEGVKMVVNPFCEIAVEEALRIRERQGGGEVVAVTVGPAGADPQLRTALAMGADRGILVQAGGPLDALVVAKLLRTVVDAETPDLVLLGKQAVDDDNNQVGQILAGLLSWPQATFVSRIEFIECNRRILVDRETDAGLETVDLPIPAVVTADLRLNEPRYASLPGIMKARKKEVRVIDAASTGVDLSPKVRVLSFEAPGKRKGGRIVADAAELVSLLRDEAKVIR
jgi:electron transfer flavoprotein beta subunit